MGHQPALDMHTIPCLIRESDSQAETGIGEKSRLLQGMGRERLGDLNLD